LLRSSLALLLCGPLLSAAPTDITGQRETSKHPASPEQVYLIIRSDDAGMSHSVNMALEKLIETGLPVDALMSPRFRDALKARNIQLLTYRQLIAMQGLNSMRRPEG
jgi:hypothetical protein